MKSERVIRAALLYLMKEKNISRNELFIITKGGFIPEDADDFTLGGENIVENLIKKGKTIKEDFVGNFYSMHPNFLKFSIEKSLNNLGINTIDLFYLQNSAEVVMPLIGKEKYMENLSRCFELFEKMILENKIKTYGLATSLCFRAKEEEKNLFLNLSEVKALAEKIGGKNNGFKFIQVPVNLIAFECFSQKWQIIKEKEVNLFTSAEFNEVNVISSQPLYQGNLMKINIKHGNLGCKNLGSKYLQLVRSIPSKSLISKKIHKKFILI